MRRLSPVSCFRDMESVRSDANRVSHWTEKELQNPIFPTSCRALIAVLQSSDTLRAIDKLSHLLQDFAFWSQQIGR